MTTLGMVPHDPVLPRLAELFDAPRMARRVADALVQAGHRRVRVERCVIERAKYKPGKNCLVTYRLQVTDPRTDAVRETRICARLYEADGSHSRYAKAMAGPVTAPGWGPSVVHLPEIDTVVWLFPNDRKLDALPKVVDGDYLRTAVFPEVVRVGCGIDWEITGAVHAITHYVPEHTCTVRADLLLRHSLTGQSRPWTIYGKTYYNDDGAATFRQMERLRESEACRRGELTIARPLAYCPTDRLLWQEGLPGTNLFDHDRHAPGYLALVEGAGQAVAALHRTPVGCRSGVGIADRLALVERCADLLGRVRPGLRAALAELVETLTRRAAHLEARPVATLHGDLHLKNLLAEGDRVALIDLDNLAVGDPLIDLGSFVAALLYRQRLTNDRGDESEAVVAALLAGYRRHVGWSVRSRDLRWHVAVALIAERAFRCLTRLKAGRLEKIDEMVQLAADIATHDVHPEELCHGRA